MENFAAAILRFSNGLPNSLRHRLRKLFIGDYFRLFGHSPDFTRDNITPEARAVLSFLEQEPGVSISFDSGRGEVAPFSYVGIRAGNGKKQITGIGAHSVFGRALFAAVAEFLERFVLSVSQSGTKFSVVRKERPGGAGILKDTKINQVKVKSIFGEAEILLPAQAIFWDYDVAEAGEPLIQEPNISGAGIAFSKAEAIAFGIYELIERDAFLSCWLKKAVPPRVDLDTIQDPEVAFLTEEARRRGLRPYILDITSDISVPTYMAALVGEHPLMASRGFSANLDPLSAIKKALYEAWGNYILNLHLVRDKKNGQEIAAASPMAERYRRWTLPASFEHFRFLLEGPVVPLRTHEPEEKSELETLKNILAQSSLSHAAYYYAPGTSPLKELGISVVKVIIPGLMPMYFREENAPLTLTHPRIYGMAQNSFPHPFA